MESSQTESGNNDPGSCTSFSSSDIDDQVITELLAEQSRLYNALSEKYSLPLKEEQLLEKMFKTRPLYEILRSELLSSSTSDSSKTVTDLKLKPPSVDHLKALQKAEKNKDLCIVDDKSTVSEMKELSESCSCCLCCVKTRLHECVQIGRRNIQAHINEKIASRSNLGQQTNSETKNIKSDPCTCACNHKNIKECQRANFPQNFHIKQPDIRQRDRFLLPTKSKPLSPNNRKQRNSYHKLKRCYFTPYMENIGEGEIKKTQKFTKLLRDNADNKNLESMEKLKLLQQKIKDSFKANNNALPKLTPEKRRIFQNILNENNKNAFIESVLTQFIDKSYLDHIQNIETVQKCELKSRIHKRIHNENVIHPSNAATTNIRKTKNVTDLLRVATKQQKHPISKRIKNNQILVNMLQISNQVQTPKESNTSLSLMKRRNSKSVPSLLSTSSVTNITSIQDKHFSLTQNARKRSSYLINTNTSGIRVKILKSLSATSIDKSSRLGKVNSPNRFPSISSYNVNKITLKVNPLTSFHKMITPIQSNTTQRVVYKNLSPSIEKTTSELPKLRRHLNEEAFDQQNIPASQILEKSNTVQVLGHYKNENLHEIGSFHNKPMSPKLKTDLHQQSKIKSDEKDNKSSSYALKKCVCNLRIKVIDIRSKINKISAKQNKVKKSSKSNDQNPLKDWMKISRLSIRDTKQFKTQATKCDNSNSFKSLNIERKKRRKRNPSFKHHFRQWSDFKLKNNLTFKKQTEQDKLIQNIPYATWKSPIHTDSKNTIDKELVVSDIMNKESKCISYLSTYDSDKAKNTNMVCESTTRLKTTSILKDASVGRDEKEIFQNQSVQTINSIQNCKVLPFLPDQFKVLCEDKSTSDHGPIQVGTVSSKQEKSKSNTTKPIYNMIFFNKGHGNYGFTITQSRVKPFYNKSDRIKLSDVKKAKQETGNYTDEPKVTPKKRGLRRFLDILKVGKLKKNKKQRNQVKLSNNTISLKNDEVETPQTKVNTVHEVVKSVINPQTCNSDFCMPIKHDFQINKEKKSKKIISNIVCKSRANTGLTSQSANFPRIKNISSNLSNKTELHIPVNKYASSARKVFNSLRFSLDVPFKRKDVINEKFFQNASKVLYTKSYTKSSHIPTLLNSKKKDRSKFFGPKIKRCLYTLKLHKRGKCNKKSCEVNTETESKIMSEIKYSDLSKGPMSKKSNNSKERPYQFNRSKPLVLLCMPHKYSTEKKHDSSKSFGPYSINTKTISNSINTRKLIVDNRTTKLLYVNKALCKQRCRPSKRIKYSGKQPELPRFSKKSFSPSINSHKYEILSENNNNREQRINKNNLNNVKNIQRHQTVSGRYSYSENICTCSRMTRSSNKHLCTYKILKNNEQCCSKLFAPSTVYTTNTVTFGQTKSKTPDILLKNTYCDTTKETLLFKSKFKCKSNHVKNQKSRINRKELMNPAQLTGVPPLVRRRYCTTMNVQVTGRNVRRKHHYYSSRLESIPYQYQKCIMERFVRKVPTVSDTERRLKTSPNSTPSVSSGSRTRRNFLKLNHNDKHQPTYARPIGGFRYKSSPRFRQPYKQEEPVGFTFGYSDFPERESNPKRQTTSRSSRTYDKYVKDSGNHTVGRCQRQSQTMMSQIVRRASNVSPMLRQCFYSLKLQKKGRLQKAREMESINQDKSTKIIADEPVTKSTQNTKKQHYPDLVPYEHESSNCVPDKCDPTWLENKERLKLRQRRRKQTEDFRADSITSHFSLTPDMISSWESREKRTQFHKYGGHRGPVRSRDIFVQPNPCEIIIEKSAIQRPRQSHIINPRLSFNKEKTHYINKKEHINFRKYAYTHGKMRNRLSRDERQKCDTDSQTVLRKHGRSSGFLKRCYCALQFLTPIRKYRRKSNTVTRMGHERTLSTLDTHIVETPSTRAPKRVRKREHFSKQIILDELSYHPYVQIAPIKCSRPRRYKNHTANCKKRTRDRISRETESFRKRISQIDVSKTRNKILWLKLRRCFSKLKFHRQIPTPEKGLIPPHEEITTFYNSRSVITSNKLRPLPSNLEHYECEPVFCVPDNYDLYKYKNRIKRLDICSSVPSTEGSLSKSNSITECQHRFLNSKPQSVMQPQSIKTRKHQYEVRRAQYITNIVHTPSKRTSNIFRIDFLKDKPPDGGVTDFKPITQHIVHKKPERVPNKLTNIPVTYKSSKEQIERGLHDKDSQVLARKMHSKMTGVGPYLKKCFCTLQLHKSPDRPFSFAMNAAQTVTKPKLNAFSTESATYTRKPYQFHSRKLRPYECEPGDYVPGLYDSYRCDQRKMLSKYSNTHPFRVPSNSSSMQDKTKCKRTQSGFCRPTQKNVRTYHRGDGHSLHKNEYLREDPFLYDSGAYRQAVQVRSSFNFNIDFCKNGSPQISSVCDINRNIKKEMKDTGTSSTRTRSISSSSNKSYIRDCQSQSECIKTEGKASRASLLQSFFCTLKPQKKEKPQYAKSEIMPLIESIGIDAKKQIIVPGLRKIGIKSEQKYPYILEPYECRLGVCVPGYCDPYDCRKRKKLRNMRHPGIGSSRITKSMSSVTSKNVETKVMNTYLHKQMRDKRRTASTETIYLIKKQLQQLSHENNNRCQSISWESGCRINKGFMKDSRFVKGNSYKSEKPIKPTKYKSKVIIHNPNKMKSKGSVAQDSLHDEWSQAGVKRESKGTAMKPILKRCFCTLTTLQRLEFKNRLRSIITNKDEAKVETTDKTTSTKKKEKKSSTKAVPLPLQQPDHKIKRIDHYEPRECKPGVCVPGECDPYECQERNKRRGIRRISRRRRPSQVSVSSTTAQFVPRYKCKKTQHEEFCVPYKMDRIVEEPRFPFFRNNLQNPMRKGVKISSNFNINIEFYKESLPYPINEEVKEKAICYKDACVECKNPNKSKTGYTCTTKHCRHRECQSQTPTTKDKSFTVAMLKRCFCTAKFRRSHLSQSSRTYSKTDKEKIKPEILFGPREYRVQYQMIQPTKNITKINPQEMKMSCKNSKHDNNFCDPADNEKNKLTFKKMFLHCNNLFNKQSNKECIYNLNQQKNNYLVKPNHKMPLLVDILKSSKSKRHSNKTIAECIKKSKSLKVAKVDGNINIIKKYSRFQSGDATGRLKKDSSTKCIRQVYPNPQVQFEQTVAVKKKVRFAAVCHNITNCIITSKQKQELKPVFFLFENKNFKHNNSKLCSCCGRAKRKIHPHLANLNFNFKNLNSARKAVTFNNPVALTSKISKPVKETMALQEIRKRHKLSCPCCVCRKHKPIMARPMLRGYGKKDGSSVCGYTISRREAETRIALIHLDAKNYKIKKCNNENRICAAKTKKKAPALEYIYIRPRRKNDKHKISDEATICDKVNKRKKLKNLCKTNKKHVTNRMKKYKDTLGSLLATKPILGISKLGVPKVGTVLPLHRAVFIPRYIYHNFQSYLRGPVRVSKNLIKRTKDGPVAAILKRFKLRLHAVKFIFSPVKVDVIIITTQSTADI